MSSRPRKKRRLRSTTMTIEEDQLENCDEEDYYEDLFYFLNHPESIIVESPEIIRLILRGLSLRCLKKCSRVCKIWKFYADKIISERQAVRTFMVSKLAKSNWQSVADIKEVENYFNELDIDTKFIILFGKLPLSRPCVGGNDLLNLRLLMPPVCPILGCLSSAGIIGTDTSSKTSDLQNPRFDCFSCMSFPNIDGLVVRRFNLSLERYTREFHSSTPLNFENFFGILPDDRVKCLILFCPTYYPFELTKEIFSAFYQRENGLIAMAGGVCEDVIEASPEAHEISEYGLTGFAFCGNDRVTAGSFVIPPKAKTKTAIQSSIFKCTNGGVNLKGSKSFGFIFTCCGRGTRIFKTTGVETGLIKEKFPKTPFVGAFSLGECGVNYWPATAGCGKIWEPLGDVPPLPDVMHSFTTTVAVISVG